MKNVRFKKFANGVVYCFKLDNGSLIETTDTFLPFYTKDSVNSHNNVLITNDYGTRMDRFIIGVSCMSGCPVKCKFCATGRLKKCRLLTAEEIIEQVEYVINKNSEFDFIKAKEHKINYTRMGEPFLNIDAVKKAIQFIDAKYPGTHHYISTIGVKGSDFSWIKDNITLQISLHSLDEQRRDELIPFKNKMSIQELGQIRTNSHLKTTINLTLVGEEDFDIDKLKEFFDPAYFFIKLSPINPNCISDINNMGPGVITGMNLI